MKKEIKNLSSFVRNDLNIKIPHTHTHILGVEISRTNDGLVYKQSSSENVCDDDISSEIIEKAIVMLGRNSHAYFHFPMEYISQLYHIKEYDLSNFKFIIGNGKNNDWLVMWIKLFFPNMDDKNIIILKKGRPLFLKYAVMVGRTFGLQIHTREIPDEIKWMNQYIIKNLQLNNNIANKLLLVKRNYSRTLNDWSQLKKICKKYCRIFNLELDVFDDATDLGTVKEQLIRFNSAKIIIGSHGAGFTNLIGCHQTDLFIEICGSSRKRPTGIGNEAVLFEVMAKTLEINYHKIISDDGEVKLHEIETILTNINKTKNKK